MTKFRPCIDLHDGQVKQVVGGSFTEGTEAVDTNHVSDRPASYFAELYQRDELTGGHVIKLGPGNDEAARSALAAYPGGLQIGGGINAENASEWLEAGASHVVVTSYVFDQDGRFLQSHLDQLLQAVGAERLVLDLSCRSEPDGGWVVAMDRWRKRTELSLEPETVRQLAECCDEFLIHAADVEGQCGGIDEKLVRWLGDHCPITTTYAGGARSIADLELVDRLSDSRFDLTIGSALDLFGGNGARYEDCVAFNRR